MTNELMQFVASLGTAGVVGKAASWLLELAFRRGLNWSSETKRFVVTVIAVLMAIVSYVGVTYIPPEVFADLEPWFKVLATGLVVGGSMELEHRRQKSQPDYKPGSTSTVAAVEAGAGAQAVAVQGSEAGGDIKAAGGDVVGGDKTG